MYILYNILVIIYGIVVRIVSVFNNKAKLWIDGRRGLLQSMSKSIDISDRPIWFHAASLGEFEQGRPLIEEVKRLYPHKKILLTFYSPSGFEVMKNYDGVDWVYYLPLDTKSNSNKLVDIINPQMVIFIKYEFWPNLIKSLSDKGVKTIVVSAIFRSNHIFFKRYGGWMRSSLKKLSMLFVQDNKSIELLKSIGIENVKLSGDTRFDRVMDIIGNDNTVDFVSQFKSDNKLIVAGSTWPDDDKILLDFINNYDGGAKLLIAPHNISLSYNKKLVSKINKKTVLFSEKENKQLEDFDVLILDTVGILTKVYSYADIVYVGGGFGKEGIHNILEPAVFSIPVITGPIFHQFKEAVDLFNLGGMLVVNSSEEFIELADKLLLSENIETGKIALNYINNNSGAQKIIFKYISENI